MGLLDRLRRSREYRPDPCAGDPTAEALLAALAADDLDVVRSTFDGARTDERLEFLCEVASAAEGRPAVLDAWVSAEPRSARAHLVRGAHGIGWAWAARGRTTADQVSDAAFETFFERLRDAEADLFGAIDRDPSDGVAWSRLVISGRGLQIPKSELHARWRSADERSPRLLRAHLELLQGVSAKWSGSDEEALRFARGSTQGLAGASPLLALVPSAHIEHWLSDEEHLRRHDVQDEIVAAADRSIWHPAWQDRPEHIVALDHFCTAFLLGGASTAAERVARQIAGRYGGLPWRFIGGPPAGLRGLR